MVERNGHDMVTEAAVQELCDGLEDRLGDDLHGVVSARRDDGVTHTVQYLRPDIDERYDDEDREALAQELIFSGMEEDYLEEIYHLGERRYTVERFANAALAVVAVDDAVLAIGMEPEGLDHTRIVDDVVGRLTGGDR